MNKKEKHVVLGANGNSGKALIQHLFEKGYNVEGVSRSGKGPREVKIIKANALNSSQLKVAIAGADIIYHCIGIPYSRWSSDYPIIMKNLIKAASANGKYPKIIYVDNLYAYGEAGARLGPLSEKSPEIAKDKKGKIRKEMTQMLLDAHVEGKVRVAIGRASDFYGPDTSNSVLSYMLFPKLMAGKPASFFATLDKKHSWMYLPDFVRALVVLGTQEEALGKVWILPHQPIMTITAFTERFYEMAEVDIPVKVKKTPQIILSIGGLFNKDFREYGRVNYQMHMDWVVDDSKFRDIFDFNPTPLDQSITETVDYYRINS